MLQLTTHTIAGLNKVLKGSGIFLESIHSDFDFISFLRKGAKKSALRNIAAQLGIPLAHAVDFLSISKDDFIEMEEDELFSPQLTERIIRLAELISRGNEVWENSDKFKAWLNVKLPALFLNSNPGVMAIAGLFATPKTL